MMRSRLLILLALVPLTVLTTRPALLPAQATPRAHPSARPTLSRATRGYVSIDTAILALTHVRVIDGTGAAPRENQTLIMANGAITALGADGRVTIPPTAMVMDLAGKTVIPGLVMLHEHLFYPTGPGVYGNLAESFTRLYLAGGVTSMRTAGNTNGYADLIIKTQIDSGMKPGPWIDATAPYLEGPNTQLQMHALTGPADARAMVNFWADAGATSFKAYMNITRDELKAAIDEAHKRGLKVTAHLCSVTFHEAAAMGIDNLEHGFYASTDFVPTKKPDVCPGQGVGQASVAALDTSSAVLKALIADLVQHKVALTSTLTVFETFVPGRPLPPGLDVLLPELKTTFEQTFARTQRGSTTTGYAKLFPAGRAFEVMFARAGGLLVAGTDPTGGGGVIPGYADQRQMELLVESGFTPLEVIKICTMNGATYLGRADRVGSIAVGKQADLVVIGGNPAAQIADIRKVETVFKQGVGYDPAKLIASVTGKVGLF